jgi:hypothetical protein
MLPSNPALDPFYEPDIDVVVSILPSTWVWVLIAVYVGYRLGRKLVHAIRFWWRQRYRREALERLRVIALEDRTGVVAQAHELLKIVAIYLWGRTRVASVPERDWYVFLDAYTPDQTFGPELSSRVFAVLYQERSMSSAEVSEYLDACRSWIQTHEVHHERL